MDNMKFCLIIRSQNSLLGGNLSILKKLKILQSPLHLNVERNLWDMKKAILLTLINQDLIMS